MRLTRVRWHLIIILPRATRVVQGIQKGLTKKRLTWPNKIVPIENVKTNVHVSTREFIFRKQLFTVHFRLFAKLQLQLESATLVSSTVRSSLRIIVTHVTTWDTPGIVCLTTLRTLSKSEIPALNGQIKWKGIGSLRVISFWRAVVLQVRSRARERKAAKAFKENWPLQVKTWLKRADWRLACLFFNLNNSSLC